MARGASKTHIGPGNGVKYRVGPQGWYTKIENRPPYVNKKVSLEEMVDMHIEESSMKNAKFQEWMNEMKSAAIKNLKIQIGQLAKKFQIKKPEIEFEECKVLSHSEENEETKWNTGSENKFCGVSYLRENNVAYGRIPSQLPDKEPNPESFYFHALLKTTSMVEMADMSRTSPKETVDNILLRVNKFIFPGDFLVIDMIDECNNNLILGRSFLATSHANIKVFEKEIALENGKEKITFNHNGSLKSINTNIEEVCMIKEANDASIPTNVDLYTKPILCDSDSCEDCDANHFEERVSYSKQAQNRHNRIMSRVMDGRNHVMLTETGDCSKNIPPEESNQHFKINCTNPEKRPKRRDYWFNEWIAKGFGTTNIDKRTRLKVFVEWMIDSYSDESNESRKYDDPFERSFEQFKLEFEREVLQLLDEYELKIGIKGYMPQDIGEKCDRTLKKGQEVLA
ncbi:hypothetical protein CTI12_AA208360 [Artemisia annua]|uniref:Reverse transcriptase domain-containing protein n=1 Tax=Artemisia annua TaxID=35608 RepID=A0A2U1NZB7_ARTAN|nr:hypothetical protein CTI12_AA208360 [Artemisia annua]